MKDNMEKRIIRRLAYRREPLKKALCYVIGVCILIFGLLQFMLVKELCQMYIHTSYKFLLYIVMGIEDIGCIAMGVFYIFVTKKLKCYYVEYYIPMDKETISDVSKIPDYFWESKKKDVKYDLVNNEAEAHTVMYVLGKKKVFLQH